MLTRFELRNFKRFDESGIALDPRLITVLIGANGSGKSSVLQALMLLKQSRAQGGLIVSGGSSNLGTYRDVVHLQQVDRHIEFGLVVTVDSSPDALVMREGKLADEVEFDSGGVYRSRGELRGNGITIDRSFRRGLPADAGEYERIHPLMNVAVNARELVGFPLLAVGYSFPEGDTPDARPLQNEFERILQSVATHLERTSLVPALRGLDRPGYSVMSDAPDINLTEMVGPDAQAAAVVNTIAARPELAEAVAIQLRTVLSRPELESLRSRLLANSNLSGEAVAGPVSVNLVNEAFGLNQLLPALLWLSAAPPGGIIGIEEPEIHLHPRSQVQLCDLLLAVAKEQRKQVVLTTHSEHVLIGFLTAIAEDRLSPEDLSVYEFRAHGATAKAQLLEVNEHGQITGGLRGFMEVDMENIAQLIEAMFRQGDE